MASPLFLVLAWLAAFPSESSQPVAEENAEQAHEATTRQKKTRPAGHDDEMNADDVAALAGAPEEMLGGLMGTGLIRDGGPLAPTRLRIRGLSGPRNAVLVGGVSVDDPTWGQVDISGLPLQAAAILGVKSGSAPGALGGALNLRLRQPSASGFKARALTGSAGTHRLSTWAWGDQGSSQAFGYLDAGTTRGDFEYRPPLASANALHRRQNNDQLRLQGLAAGQGRAGLLHGRLVLWGNAHQGGIPGFSESPLAELRGDNSQAGAALEGWVPMSWGVAGLEGSGGASRRSVLRWAPPRPTP
jgi:hypothetical protein